MNFITRQILLTIFKTVNPQFTFKTASMVESKAKTKAFKFFYFYGLSNNDTTLESILKFQKAFKTFYPMLHCNISNNKHGLTVWISDDVRYDALMVNQIK